MSKSLPTSGFKCLNPKMFILDKYNHDILCICVLEVDLEYPRRLCYLNYDYPLAPDKLEIKRETLCEKSFW